MEDFEDTHLLEALRIIDRNPVLDWTQKECYNWAHSVAQSEAVPLHLTNVDGFLCYTGYDLIQFREADFQQKIDMAYGSLFYHKFQALVNSQGLEIHSNNNNNTTTITTINNNDSSLYCYNEYNNNNYYNTTTPTYNSGPTLGRNDTSEPEHRLDYTELHAHIPVEEKLSICAELSDLGSLDNNMGDLTYLDETKTASRFPGTPEYTTEYCDTNMFDLALSSDWDPNENFLDGFIPMDDWVNDCTLFQPPTPSPEPFIIQPTPVATSPTHHTERKRKNPQPTPDTNTTYTHNLSPLAPLQTPSRKRSRGPKNWEFVMRLLVDPSTNPSLVQWVNKEQGTFKFNKPSEIAKLWGRRSKNRQPLSYDNFARGLRYHYGTGALCPVSEKQLVYCCGQKARQFLCELTKSAADRH